MAHKCLLHDTTRAKLETATCHLLDSLKDLIKMSICHQGSHQPSTEEKLERATRDHQLTQELPMFTLTKTRYSTLNSNLKQQATKTMFQQAFLPDLSWEGIRSTAWTHQSNIIINQSHRLHKPALAKPVICITISQILQEEDLETQITICMNHLHTDQDWDTENKWKVQE